MRDRPDSILRTLRSVAVSWTSCGGWIDHAHVGRFDPDELGIVGKRDAATHHLAYAREHRLQRGFARGKLPRAAYTSWSARTMTATTDAAIQRVVALGLTASIAIASVGCVLDRRRGPFRARNRQRLRRSVRSRARGGFQSPAGVSAGVRERRTSPAFRLAHASEEERRQVRTHP